jgi:hypothetical protein
MTMTQKTNLSPWALDVRVRERNLKNGSITEKDVEKHLSALPDLADSAEAFAAHQPALAHSSIDDDDDDDDDDDGEDVDGVAEPNAG